MNQLAQYATTFGGAEINPDSQLYKEGEKLGKILANNGYIVKCGGYYGLMEAVSKGVKEAGGICLGITNGSFDPKPANKFISREIKHDDLFSRLRELICESKLFVFQQGSIGTLEELCMVWTLRYTLTINDVRICLIGSFWNQVIHGLKHLSINPKEFGLLELYENIEHFSKTL